jgi:pyrimidine-nucleoside phosphorylase
VIAQGGDVTYVDLTDKLPRAVHIEEVPSPRSGYLKWIDAKEIGETSVEIGAGRQKKSDSIDHAVGIVVHHKVGDQLKKGEPLFALHVNDQSKLAAARQRITSAHKWSAKKVKPLPLFYDTVTN